MRFRKTPYTHFNSDNKFPVMAIFIKPSGIRFTKGKIYELTPCVLKQAGNCMVTDDNGTLLTYWELLSDDRDKKFKELGL